MAIYRKHYGHWLQFLIYCTIIMEITWGKLIIWTPYHDTNKTYIGNDIVIKLAVVHVAIKECAKVQFDDIAC